MEGGTGDLEALLAEKQQAAHQQALALRKERKRLAKELEQQILTELKELYLERTEFEVRFTELEHLQENGLDGVEFYITTNPGTIKTVSSGGFWRRTFASDASYENNLFSNARDH